MNDWVGFVDQRDVKGLKCCVVAFRGKKSTNFASIPDTLRLTHPPSCFRGVVLTQLLFLSQPIHNCFLEGVFIFECLIQATLLHTLQ